MPNRLSFVKNRLYENIFNHANGGIAIVGLDGGWVKVNESLCQILGYKEDELYQMSFQDITHKEDLNKDIQYIHDLLDNKIECFQDEKRYFHKDGHVVWTLISVFLMREDNGTPLYFISQIVDISEQKESERQLELLMHVAEQQNEKLINFAHITTHDFRTHIGNLDTLTSFIEEENDHIKNDDNFKLLKDAIIQLNDTLSHLSEIRKQDLADIEELKNLNVSEFVESAIYNVTAIAKLYGFEIVNQVPTHLAILGIEAYLDSVILNFLTNAIKYRKEEGKSHLIIDAVEHEEFVALSFKDNGLGIDLNQNGNRLFKLNATFHKRKDSRGVGLFITKNHVERMGGRIEVKSQVGKGTCFTVYLKRA